MKNTFIFETLYGMYHALMKQIPEQEWILTLDKTTPTISLIFDRKEHADGAKNR